MSHSKSFCFIRTITLLILLLHLPATALAKNDRVVWNPGRIEQTLGLSETAETIVTFVSSTPLENVDLWIVPELSPYVRVEPAHFDDITANSLRNVTVHFSVPFGTKPGPYDGTVHLRTGTSTHPDTLKINLNVAGLVLSPPSEEAVDRARIIQEQIPGARLHFSQIHGQLMMVESGSPDPDGSVPLNPLAESRGISIEERASTILDYLNRFKDVYQLDDPTRDMKIPLDPVNDQFRETNEGQFTNPSALTMIQTHQGIRIQGRYALGMFDSLGDLQTIVTRILPVPQIYTGNPSLTPDQAMDLLKSSLEDLITKTPGLHWLRNHFGEAERTYELLWIPETKNADSPLRLAYEIKLRKNLNKASIRIDAHTGMILRASDLTPSDNWYNDGTVYEVTAPDEVNISQSIFTSSYLDRWYMGYGRNYDASHPSKYFNTTERLNLSDTVGKTHRDRTYWDTISIDDIGYGIDSWWYSPGYLRPDLLAATSLMRNATATLEWWSENGWRSWDGRGSTLWTSINNNHFEDTSFPSLNGWGGDGVLQVGDGLTPTGKTLAYSLEFIGHEFMHSVIDATTRLVYQDEPGAINEALSDYFGSVLTAQEDRFNNNLIGEIDDFSARDMRDPYRDRYDMFLVTENDHGGVHTNSGILNKAHWLLVEGGSFRYYEIPSIGVEKATNILRLANQFRFFNFDTSMEEFAVSIIGFCNLLERNGAIPDEGICDAFSIAYRSTQLLPSPEADLSLDEVTYYQRRGDDRFDLRVVVTNTGHVDQDLRNFTLYFIDELGNSVTAIWEYSARCSGVILPGTNSTCFYSIPSSFLDGTLTRVRKLTASLLPINPGADYILSNNSIYITFGSDYVVNRSELTGLWPFPDGNPIEIRNTMGNRSSLSLNSGRFPPGMSAVYLERSSSHGPMTMLEERNVPPNTFSIELPKNVEFIELPYTDRSWDDGSIWFDQLGGLSDLDGKTQIYLLTDAYDIAEETDETNNLLCANCYMCVSSDACVGGVIIRLQKDTPISSIFPTEYQKAASKLLAEYPRIFDVGSLIKPDLLYKVAPEMELP